MKRPSVAPLACQFRLIVLVASILAIPTHAEIVVPINLSRGLVEVDVLLDGRVEGRFGIDTGADDLYIDRAFATASGLEIGTTSRKRQVVSIAGTSSVAVANLRSLAIQDETVYNLTATVVDINELGGRSGNHPDGLIGYEFLRQFYITVDYADASLTLQQDEPDFLSGNQYESIPFQLVGHQIIIEADFGVCGRPMLLDYCASHTSLSPQLAAELDLHATVGSRVQIKSISLGDGISSEDVYAIVQNYANLKGSRVKPAFDGILGASFLQDHIITVDYMRSALHIHSD